MYGARLLYVSRSALYVLCIRHDSLHASERGTKERRTDNIQIPPPPPPSPPHTSHHRSLRSFERQLLMMRKRGGIPYMTSTTFWDFFDSSTNYVRKIYTVCPLIWGIFGQPLPFCLNLLYGSPRREERALSLVGKRGENHDSFPNVIMFRNDGGREEGYFRCKRECGGGTDRDQCDESKLVNSNVG